jgi:hypothetical protein
MTTAAAIDRLVHHSTILELNAGSYRAAKAERAKKNLKVDISQENNIESVVNNI